MNTAHFLALLRLPSDEQRSEALRLAIELGVGSVDADEGSLLVLDEATRELVFAVTVGDSASASTLAGQRVPMGKGLTGLAALTGELQVGAPTYGAIDQAPHRAAQGPRYLIAAPMFAHDKLVGVLTAASFRRSSQFTAQHVQLFGRVAALAGVVIADGQQTQTMREAQADQLVARGPLALLQRDVALLLQPWLEDETRARALLTMLQQLTVLTGR